MARKPARIGIPGYTVVKQHTRSYPGQGSGQKKQPEKRKRKRRGSVTYL